MKPLLHDHIHLLHFLTDTATADSRRLQGRLLRSAALFLSVVTAANLTGIETAYAQAGAAVAGTGRIPPLNELNCGAGFKAEMVRLYGAAAESGKEPLKALVSWQNAPFRKQPDAESLITRRAQEKFLRDSMYHVLEVHPAGSDQPDFLHLVLSSDGKRVDDDHGWVERSQCVLFVENLIKALRDPRENISRKAMLRNVLPGAGSAAELSAPVDFTDRPDSLGDPLQQRALFRIYYVYAEWPIGKPTHLLLGRRHQIEERGSGAQRSEILGWVPVRRVCPWNTREAIEFNKPAPPAGEDSSGQVRTQPARFFRQRADVEAHLQFEDVDPLAVEDLGSPRWDHRRPRYPLISDEDLPHQGKPVGATRIFKVGVIGDVVMPGSDRIAAREIEQLRGIARQYRDRADVIEVCFLIDATFSMSKWFDAASEAVRKIMQTAQSLERATIRPNVRFSVNFYRDRNDGERMRLENNPFGRSIDALRLLGEQVALGGGRPYEEVFRGISHTLKKSAFDEKTVKIFVLIGDDGNDPKDAQHTIESVSRDLIKAGGAFPIGFFAIGVGDESSRQHKLFVKQTTAIAAALAAHQRETIIADLKLEQLPEEEARAIRRAVDQLFGQTLVSRDIDSISEAITQRFELAIQEVQFRVQAIEDLKDGVRRFDSSTADSGAEESYGGSGAFGLIWSRQMDNLIRQEGLQKLELARQGVQLFSEAWIAETEPAETIPRGGTRRPPAIRHVAFMEKRELRHILVVLEAVLERWDPRKMEYVWKSALDLVTGGDVRVSSDQSPQRLAEMYLGIKVRSDILAHNFNDPTIWNDAAKMARLRRELRRKVDELEDVLEDREATYTRVVKTGTDGKPYVVYERSNVRDRSYWWSEDADFEATDQNAWIERDRLP